MIWTQARRSVSGDYPVIEIEDENGVTVADVYLHEGMDNAGLIALAPDMKLALEKVRCYCPVNVQDQIDELLGGV